MPSVVARGYTTTVKHPMRMLVSRQVPSPWRRSRRTLATFRPRMKTLVHPEQR